MAGRVKNCSKTSSRRSRPSLTPEGREDQLVNLAVNLAEQQLRDGTASSQIIAHYLKRGSMREKLEMERLAEENKLLRAKTEALQSQRNIEELYTKAIKAMRSYSGGFQEDDDEY